MFTPARHPWKSPGDDVHVYFDPADGRLDLLPHGMDETFVRDERSVLEVHGLLFAACLTSEACGADYEASVWDAVATADRIDLLGYAQEVRDQIAPFAEADPVRPYTWEEVVTAQAEMLEFVANRADQLAELLGGP